MPKIFNAKLVTHGNGFEGAKLLWASLEMLVYSDVFVSSGTIRSGGASQLFVGVGVFRATKYTIKMTNRMTVKRGVG